MMTKKKKIQAIKVTWAAIFKDSKGQPYQLTDGQARIVLAILDPRIRWLWISAPTRYGKTDVLATALLYLASYERLKLPIVGGSESKAEKIMEYVVSHLGDHPSLYEGLLNIEDVHDVDKLKVTVSKKALRWRHGGWIYITSIESRSIKKEGEGVVGEGGDVVTLEEAGLIKDEGQFSKVVRMPEEDKGWGKLIMSGNCIEGSIFEDGFNNPLYRKVRVSLEQAIAEGRYTQGYLDEKKGQTTSKDWKRYYLVEFPLANEFTYFKPQKYEILPRDLVFYGALDPSLGEEGKAIKTKKGSKQGIVVIGFDVKTGLRYEVDSIVDHLGPDTAVDKVFNMPYTFKRFGLESVQFQNYFLKVTKERNLQLGINIPFEGINQRTNKNERIESLEPFINTGQILFKGDNQLWEDMAEYPKTEFLDGLDALEMAYRISVKKKPSIGFGGEVY